MAAKVVRAVAALGVTAGLLLVPASASARAQTRHASATDVCHSVTLPGVPPPFNVVTVCVPVPSVG